MLDIALQPRRVALIGLCAALLLVMAYAATQAYRVKVAPAKIQTAMSAPSWPKDDPAATAAREQIVNPRGVVRMFDLDAEGNIPAIWSVVQLLAAALLLFIIARHAKVAGDRSWRLWSILAVGFVFLALDEGGSIHSSFYLSAGGEAQRKSRGIFYFSWIIPALIAATLVGLVYLRFLWQLPALTRVLFIVAGAGYVGSGAGGEMMQGWWVASGYSKIRMSFAAMTIAEEAGEMLSILLFVCALLDYMRRQNIAVRLRVAGEAMPAVVVSKSAPITHVEPSLEDVDDDAEILLPR